MTIRAIVRGGHRARIVNCFTVSNYAPNGQTAAVAEVGRIREREDRDFAARIGGGVEIVNLGRSDAPLRLKCPVSSVRRRAVGDAERDEARQIVKSLTPYLDGGLLIPLGLGAHIDHLVALETGIQLGQAGQPVGFYEDLPYAAEMRECCILRAADRASRRLGTPLSGVLIRDTGGTQQKHLAIGAYASQVSSTQLQSVIDYAQSHGECERIWMSRRVAGNFPVEIERVDAQSASGGTALRRRLYCARHESANRAKAILRHTIQLSRARSGVNGPN